MWAWVNQEVTNTQMQYLKASVLAVPKKKNWPPRFWICWALAAMLEFPIPSCHWLYPAWCLPSSVWASYDRIFMALRCTSTGTRWNVFARQNSWRGRVVQAYAYWVDGISRVSSNLIVNDVLEASSQLWAWISSDNGRVWLDHKRQSLAAMWQVKGSSTNVTQAGSKQSYNEAVHQTQNC